MGALFTQSWWVRARGFHFPTQLPSPWCSACSDTLLRVLQGSAQLGAELQPPYHSWREQKLLGAEDNELPIPPTPILTDRTPFPLTSAKLPRSFSHHRGTYVFISWRGWWHCFPWFTEALMLWQPKMKVFVLILPSRHESSQKMARYFLGCLCGCCGGKDKQPISAELNRNIEKGMGVV